MVATWSVSGVDGRSWGLGLRGARRRQIVDDALAQVGAERYAGAPLGVLSGGEQQRLRVAQALTADPALLLCDEPLASLDPANQQLVVELIDARRRNAGTAVVFVTHEINPVLPMWTACCTWWAGSSSSGRPMR